MALADFVFQLKALAGDSAPTDKKAGLTLAGGTPTLVDLGGGSDPAWQFSGQGSVSSAAISKITNVDAAGGGVTIAVRVAVSMFSGAFGYLFGFTSNTTPSKGLTLTEAGTTGASATVRARYVATSNDTQTGTLPTVGTAIKTYVLRFRTAPSGTLDKVDMWLGGANIGAGNAADYVTPGQNQIADTLNTIILGAAGATLKCSDFVVWHEELSDADCHALAYTAGSNSIRATLDAALLTSLSGSVSLDAADASGAISSQPTTLGGSVTLDDTAASGAILALASGMSGTVTLDDVAPTGNLSPAPGVLITPILRTMPGGPPRALESGWSAHVYDATTGDKVTTLTGLTTGADGRLQLTSTAIKPGSYYKPDPFHATHGHALPSVLAA